MPISEFSDGLILDTHIWIWLNAASPELTSKTISTIHNAANNGKLLIQAISIWEIATLESKGRLTMNVPLEQWIAAALTQPGITLLPLLPEIAIESARLPNEFHGDPADRMIVAAARITGSTVLTRDAKILAYGKKGLVHTLKG